MSDLAKELRRFSFHDKISTMPWETLKLIDAGADRIEELEAALRNIAQHDMQAIALDALERGSRTSQMRRKTDE